MKKAMLELNGDKNPELDDKASQDKEEQDEMSENG